MSLSKGICSTMNDLVVSDNEVIETSYAEILQECTSFSTEEIDEFLEKYPDFNPLNFPMLARFYLASFEQTLRMRQFEKVEN